MKNTMLAAGSLSLALMAGCAGTKPADQTAASTDTSAQKTIHILAKDQNGNTVVDEDITTTAGNLTDALKSSEDLNATFENGEYGTMIMGLEGLATEDWNKGPWWTYESDNNTVCQKEGYCPAADDVIIADGDSFVFTFSSGS